MSGVFREGGYAEEVVDAGGGGGEGGFWVVGGGSWGEVVRVGD